MTKPRHDSGPNPIPAPDVDWLVIGSGFGGSVAALRLAEKGYRVAVIERGRRYADEDLPASASDRGRFLWAPAFGLRGIMRNVPFRHVFSSTQTGVGGGSLVYGGVLFRAQEKFFQDAQWRELGNWAQTLDPHYSTAEHMLGVQTTPWESVTMGLTREVAEQFGTPETFAAAPVGVFFGMPGVRVDDPYFGGEGPARTGCTRCGSCMVGCRVGAANRLTKNYLWFAEKHGAQITAEREVIDVSPIGSPDGRDGYRVTTQRPGAPFKRDRTTITTRGVVFAGGAVGTNELLADCKHRGSLPRISDRLGTLVRTNSEAVLSVLLPEDRETWRDVTASSRVILDGDTQIEFLTYGQNGDFMRLMFTVLTGEGAAPKRLAKWLVNVARHPGQWVETMRPGWSSRTLMMLVMQARDNAIRFKATKRRLGRGYRLTTEVDSERPAPTYLEIGHQVAKWVAERTGGIAQSSIFEAFGNIPMTAHVLGGATIGADAHSGVLDQQLRVFGYENMMVCDAAALPANPGVNPALTIAALAEHAMAHVPLRAPQ
ncbi:GMC oxidoreductase [Smaragdicoccus niigatensis]|uniref:GMC oxidoreductase n=1 Tax=Smaragdicoccus niigatensis TaxID=359359 RepID=UPI00037FC040|nr:GMC family oxidoreductase [Smaragdicoccus niigatensis]